MKKFFRQLMSKNGYVSILVIFMVGFTMPFFMFYFVELNHLYTMKDKYQAFADASASGAVMQLERESILEGNLVLDEDEARSIAEQLIARNYNLTSDLQVTDDSLVTEPPIVKIYTVGFDVEDGENFIPFVTDEGFVYNIEHPTVIIYTESKPRGIFYSQFVGIQTISAYEVFYKKGVETNLNSESVNNDTNNDLVFRVNRVVNPISYPNSSDNDSLEWRYEAIPMAAGGNIELSVASLNPDFTIEGVEYELVIEGYDYHAILSRTMTEKSHYEFSDTVTLPEDAPIGSIVKISFYDSGIRVINTTGSELKGNVDVGILESDKTIGSLETNLFKLIRIQKKYQE